MTVNPDEGGPAWSGLALLALVILVLVTLVFVGLPRHIQRAIEGQPPPSCAEQHTCGQD